MKRFARLTGSRLLGGVGSLPTPTAKLTAAIGAGCRYIPRSEEEVCNTGAIVPPTATCLSSFSGTCDVLVASARATHSGHGHPHRHQLRNPHHNSRDSHQQKQHPFNAHQRGGAGGHQKFHGGNGKSNNNNQQNRDNSSNNSDADEGGEIDFGKNKKPIIHNHGWKEKLAEKRNDFISKFKQVSRKAVTSQNFQKIINIFGEPKVQRYTDGPGFIAALKVKNPSGEVTTCVGYDIKRKSARTLALYHAHLVMQAYDEHQRLLKAGARNASSPSSSTTTASNPAVPSIASALGGAPPAPSGGTSPSGIPIIPPIMFDDSVARLSNELPTLPKNAPKHLREQHLFAFRDHRLPIVGDPVFDRAALLVKQYERDDPKGIRALWKQTSTRRPVMSRVSGVWMARMKVPGYANYPAVGCGPQNNIAQHRCILHALLMMRMAKEGTLDLSGLAPQDAALIAFYLKSTQVKPAVEQVGVATAAAANMSAVSTGPIPPAPPSHVPPAPKVGEAAPSRRYQRVKVTIGEYSAEAEAINEIEAQKKAVVSIVKEMMRSDAALQELARFVNEQRVELNGAVPQMSFPDRLIARLEEEYNQLETTEVKSLLAPKHKSVARPRSAEQLEAESQQMKEARRRVLQSETYKARMEQTRNGLSISAFRDEFLDLVKNNQVTILCGTTGCGKSTQIPQYIFDAMIEEGRGAEANIIVTQPRRISAISIAERVASERLQQLRDDIGYSIRLDNSAGRHMTFMTTGILMAAMVSDPTLNGITHLVIDEIHERDVNTDVILSLVKKLTEARKDLRIVLMSATMQSKLFAAYFKGAPILNVEGRMFPVKTFYLEELEQMVRRSPSANRDLGQLDNYIQEVQQASLQRPMQLDCRVAAMAVRHALATEPVARDNAVLIFLPGWADIVATERELNADGPGRYHIIKLHSSVSMAGQRACFAPTPAGKTKIILATNIAESGITIDGVTVVIDAAMSFLTYYTRRHANAAFVTEMKKIICSRASTTQRMGRAGRTQQGRYFCLMTRDLYEETPGFHTAEILRVSLDNVILRLLGMGLVDAPKLLSEFIEPPPKANVDQAMKDLRELGALDEQGQLTLLGHHLAKVPTEPRQSKILITSMMLGCLESGMTAVASTEIDPFSTNRDLRKEVKASKQLFAMGTNSDQLARVNGVHSWIVDNSLARKYSLDEGACKKLLQYKEQYRRVLRDSLHVNEEAVGRESFSTVCLRAAVASGYFPKIALSNKDSQTAGSGQSAKKNAQTFVTRTDRGISLSRGSAIDVKSPNLPSPFYIVYDDIFVPPMSGPAFSNATFVTMMELVVIATPMTRIKYFEKFSLAIIDGWIPFVITKKQFDVLQKIKTLIDVRVWQKLESPTNTRVAFDFDRSMQIVKDLLFLSAREGGTSDTAAVDNKKGVEAGASGDDADLDDDDDDDDDEEDDEEEEGGGGKGSASVHAAMKEFSKNVVDFTKDTPEILLQRLNAAAAARDED